MKQYNQPKLQIINKPNEFFYNILSSKFKNNNLCISQDVEFYLVDLLSRFIKSENFYTLGTNGELKNEPLAFLLKEAEEEQTLEVKKLLYRQIGDMALYTLGLFPDDRVSKSYYGFMGKNAYGNAATLYGKNHLKDLYRQLSIQFELIAFTLRDIPDLNIKK